VDIVGDTLDLIDITGIGAKAVKLGAHVITFLGTLRETYNEIDEKKFLRQVFATVITLSEQIESCMKTCQFVVSSVKKDKLAELKKSMQRTLGSYYFGKEDETFATGIKEKLGNLKKWLADEFKTDALLGEPVKTLTDVATLKNIMRYDLIVATLKYRGCDNFAAMKPFLKDLMADAFDTSKREAYDTEVNKCDASKLQAKTDALKKTCVTRMIQTPSPYIQDGCETASLDQCTQYYTRIGVYYQNCQVGQATHNQVTDRKAAKWGDPICVRNQVDCNKPK